MGLTATLWSTLIGQTIPDLIKAGRDPLADFRHAGNAACAQLRQGRLFTVPGPEGPSQLPRAETLDVQEASLLATQFNRRTANPFTRATNQLFTLSAPGPYAGLFGELKNDMTAVDADLGGLVRSIYEMGGETPPHSRAKRALVLLRSSYLRALRGAKAGQRMGLNKCTGALFELTEDIQTLDGTLVPLTP